MDGKLLSLIVPCYNEEVALPIFYKEIVKIAAKLEHKYELNLECLIVDDGSSDNTLQVAKDLKKEDERIKYLSFSRNFGKEAAIYAGLENANGDFVAILDVDLQDPPELLDEMYFDIQDSSYDCVATRRVTRKGEPPIRSFFARLFYRLINKMSKVEIVDGARDYRMMTRQMVNAVLSVKEYNRFSKGLFSWVGFKTKWLEYENRERSAGETKWSFRKLFLYSLDGIVAYTTIPLSFSSIIGFIFCLISVIMIVFYITKTIMWGDPVAGYPSLVCIILFIGGVQLFGMGILGQYLEKTYLESKNRPIYILKEKSEELNG